jgi:predicted secreted protein
MSETTAAIGYGIVLKRRVSAGPDVYQTMGQQAEVSLYGIAVDSVDATHEESDGKWREFIPGLKDGGEASATLHYLPGGATEAEVFSSLGTTEHLRAVHPNGAHIDYRAFITGAEPDTPIDDKMTFALTWKITGEVVPSAAAAPSNAVLPSISGTPQVGIELTAYNGIWDDEPTAFTYQWKSDNVNVNGATAKTYTPIVGQIASTLTVVVTGTNSAGTASATSAGAIDVIAA